MLSEAANMQEIISRIKKCRLGKENELDLSHLKMKELPAGVKDLKNLATLNLSYNELTSLPDWIGVFSSLKSLNLRGNQLLSRQALPDSMRNLHKLIYLDLGVNFLSEVP